MLFMFGFGWGVAGAALATTLSQYVCFVVMFSLLWRNKILDPHHLLLRPVWAQWAPMLKVWPALSEFVLPLLDRKQGDHISSLQASLPENVSLGS